VRTESTLTANVPYYSQWESRQLVPALLKGSVRAIEDPLWKNSGAQSADEYEYWSWRICGIACFRMALAHWRGINVPSVPLAKECLNAGAYVRKADKLEGLIYAPFANYVNLNWGIRAEVRASLKTDEIVKEVCTGRLIMASVHPDIRDPSVGPPCRGGHLVLIVGTEADRVIFHNPSGLPGLSQDFAKIRYDDWDRFFAGRGVVLATI